MFSKIHFIGPDFVRNPQTIVDDSDQNILPRQPSPRNIQNMLSLGEKCSPEEIGNSCLVEHSVCVDEVCQCEENYVQAGAALCLLNSKSKYYESLHVSINIHSVFLTKKASMISRDEEIYRIITISSTKHILANYDKVIPY